MEANSSILRTKRSLVTNASFKVFIKYIVIILVSNLIHITMLQLNSHFMHSAIAKDIVGYVLLAIQPWISILIVYIVYFDLRDSRIDSLSLLKLVFSCFNKWIIVGIIYSLIIVVSMLLFVIPAIIAAFYYSFIWQVFVFEKLKSKSVLDKSKKEVKEKLGDVMFYIVLNLITTFVIISALFFITYFNNDSLVASSIVSMVINLFSSYFTILLTYVYLLCKNHVVYLDKEDKFCLVKGYQI